MDLKKPSITVKDTDAIIARIQKSTQGLKQGPVGSPTYTRRGSLNAATEGSSALDRISSALHCCCELINTDSCLRALAAVACRLSTEPLLGSVCGRYSLMRTPGSFWLLGATVGRW